MDKVGVVEWRTRSAVKLEPRRYRELFMDGKKSLGQIMGSVLCWKI